ncbi:hypothetical protein D8674_014710 [Pyrus ussuriensis x Pyrus communis]|uniref:Uncharacterized protein n=1 Tax=Pyrus ussuriensis x Pyrus communis TaxID=2448454 RepID=A0A5N5GY82_9ROSA|nr:hypothetical protein D8674_014710 [Pyrus ussuriensis x Pyrus communis]
MSTAGISGMMLQCVFQGSLSMQDTEIERRPYHKNCGCALHSNAGVCSNACQRNFSFPKKQSWSDVHMLLFLILQSLFLFSVIHPVKYFLFRRYL